MIDRGETGLTEIAKARGLFASEVAIFSKLTINDWVKLIKLCDRQIYISNAKILNKGQINTAIYFLVEGRVRIEQPADAGPQRLARLAGSTVFGEMSYLDGDVVSADVVAEGTVELLRLERDDLEMLARADKMFGLRFYHSLALTLSQRIRLTNSNVGKSGSGAI